LAPDSAVRTAFAALGCISSAGDRMEAHDAYDEYEDDDFEVDSEAEECEEEFEFEIVEYEDEDEVDYRSGCPFWLLEAEAAVGIENVPIDDASSSQQPLTFDDEGWPTWLLEADVKLGLGQAPTEAAKPKLARSGSFERRRQRFAGGTKAPPASNEPDTAAEKPKLVRAGSFQRRRKMFGDVTNAGAAPAGGVASTGEGSPATVMVRAGA